MDFEIVAGGGPILLPIAFCSIIAVGIFIERLIALRQNSIAAYSDHETLKRFVQLQDWSGLQTWSGDQQNLLKDMCQVVLSETRPEQDRLEVSKRLEEWAMVQANKMERGLDAIGVIASIAPMLGLMGTVLGMVVTFQSIQVHGLGNIDALAGGISQALLTTLAGLAVGIPSLVMHRYLLSRVDQRLLDLQIAATLLLDHWLKVEDV